MTWGEIEGEREPSVRRYRVFMKSDTVIWNCKLSVLQVRYLRLPDIVDNVHLLIWSLTLISLVKAFSFISIRQYLTFLFISIVCLELFQHLVSDSVYIEISKQKTKCSVNINLVLRGRTLLYLEITRSITNHFVSVHLPTLLCCASPPLSTMVRWWALEVSKYLLINTMAWL